MAVQTVTVLWSLEILQEALFLTDQRALGLMSDRSDSGALSLQVTQKFSLVIVQGHLVSEGVLLFGLQHFYVCENFTLSPVGDVYCTRHCLSK